MMVFLDTEFTGLGQAAPGLISIGLVTEDGREFYAELTDTWDWSMCSEFVLTDILPLLNSRPECRMTQAQCRERLAEYLVGQGGEVELVSDSTIDWVMLVGLLRPVAERVGIDDLEVRGVKVKHRMQFLPTDYLELAYAEGLRPHHALDDARALRIVLNFLEKT